MYRVMKSGDSQLCVFPALVGFVYEGLGTELGASSVPAVGLRADKQASAWTWPSATHDEPMPLSAFLPAPLVLRQEERDRRVAELAATGLRNLQIACADITRSLASTLPRYFAASM